MLSIYNGVIIQGSAELTLYILLKSLVILSKKSFQKKKQCQYNSLKLSDFKPSCADLWKENRLTCQERLKRFKCVYSDILCYFYLYKMTNS